MLSVSSRVCLNGGSGWGVESCSPNCSLSLIDKLITLGIMWKVKRNNLDVSLLCVPSKEVMRQRASHSYLYIFDLNKLCIIVVSMIHSINGKFI